jgi:hypothetical protein
MKNGFLLLVLLCVGLVSCDKNEGNTQVALKSGTYTGEFSRFNPDGRCTPTPVTLVIQNNSFNGFGDLTTSPAIGAGVYKLTGAEIEFTDQRVWTDEFDWTYVLNGKYKFKTIGDEVIIVRMYANQTTDVYKLHWQDPATVLNSRNTAETIQTSEE